jgi:hypothetical protein
MCHTFHNLNVTPALSCQSTPLRRQLLSFHWISVLLCFSSQLLLVAPFCPPNSGIQPYASYCTEIPIRTAMDVCQRVMGHPPSSSLPFSTWLVQFCRPTQEIQPRTNGHTYSRGSPLTKTREDTVISQQTRVDRPFESLAL